MSLSVVREHLFKVKLFQNVFYNIKLLLLWLTFQLIW